MTETSATVPSPCIDICKYSRRGHCIGCSMTQAQKRLFTGLKKPEQRAEFLQMIREQQALMGRYEGWEEAYRQKCLRLNQDDSKVG